MCKAEIFFQDWGIIFNLIYGIYWTTEIFM